MSGPARRPMPGACGPYAFADARSWTLHLRWLSDAQIATLTTRQKVSFVKSIRVPGRVTLPFCVGGGAVDWLENGLAMLLKDKGVPSECAKDRAAAAIRQLSAAKVQKAMQAKNPWRELKALGNQMVPVPVWPAV